VALSSERLAHVNRSLVPGHTLFDSETEMGLDTSTSEYPGPEATRRIILESALRLQVRLDLVDVLMGWRPVARVLLQRDGAAELVARLSIASHLEPVVDPSLVRQKRPSPDSPYVDKLDLHGPSDEIDVLVALFIARHRNSALAALEADHSADDVRLGLALGYPPCCVRFVERRGGVPTLAESLTLYGEAGFDPLIWPAASLNDAGLLPHFPCSPHCQASRELASRRLQLLMRFGSREDLNRVKRSAEAGYSLDERGTVRMHVTAARESVPFGSLRPRVPLPQVATNRDG
jgi:hypothetical protein